MLKVPVMNHSFLLTPPPPTTGPRRNPSVQPLAQAAGLGHAQLRVISHAQQEESQPECIFTENTDGLIESKTQWNTD